MMRAHAVVDRLDVKTVQPALILELQRGTDSSPVAAALLVERMERYVDSPQGTTAAGSEGATAVLSHPIETPPRA